MRIVVRAPGVSSQIGGDVVDDRRVETGERRDALVQRLGEVDLAAHRRFGDGADLVLDTGPRREHLDDLALHERRVDVEHDEPLGPAGQSPPRSTATSTFSPAATSASPVRSCASASAPVLDAVTSSSRPVTG